MKTMTLKLKTAAAQASRFVAAAMNTRAHRQARMAEMLAEWALTRKWWQWEMPHTTRAAILDGMETGTGDREYYWPESEYGAAMSLMNLHEEGARQDRDEKIRALRKRGASKRDRKRNRNAALRELAAKRIHEAGVLCCYGGEDEWGNRFTLLGSLLPERESQQRTVFLSGGWEGPTLREVAPHLAKERRGRREGDE